ncbi:MAG TPA: NERD domain-containing protein [Anaerolineales bacterium]|nr:NERD domain-containing protein [Anaerolineales bacterium]
MKLIDKTPFLDEKGELGIKQRLQGMLQFGFNWPNELQAQKAIINFFDRQLERGYTLIRNMTLGQSGITIPMILLGPAGIFAINVTHLRGRYEAKGGSWNVQSGDGYKPADVNLIQVTARMARALQVFIERQGVNLPVAVEPVLIAAEPGLHIESVGAAVKVMMIDGIKSFVTGLASGPPVLSPEAVHEYTERIVNPRSPKKAAVTAPAAQPRTGLEQDQPSEETVSRARAIFDASENLKPFDPSDFEFAMTDEEPSAEGLSSSPEASDAAASIQRSKSRRVLGMTPLQLAVIIGLAAALVCILAAFAYLVFVNP